MTIKYRELAWAFCWLIGFSSDGQSTNYIPFRRNKMKAYIVTTLLILMALIVSPMSASASDMSLFDLDVTYAGESENSDDASSSKIQRQIVRASFTLPKKIGDNLLLFGLSYNGQFIKYTDFQTQTFRGNTVTEEDLPDSLHALDISIGYLLSLSNGWSTLIQFQPGLHSDFEDISGDDVMYTGMVLAQKKYDEENTLGFGVAYSDAFGEPQAFPLFKANWRISDRFKVVSLLPLKLDAIYEFSDEFNAGFQARVNGYQYRLTEKVPFENSVLKYTEVYVGPFADFKVTEKTRLRASAGAILGQTFEIRDDDSDKVLQEGDYENSYYASLKYYFPF